MNWVQSIAHWRRLTPEDKLRLRWEAIPADVAQTMAFEGEPVPLETIRATLDEIEPPALLKEKTPVGTARTMDSTETR